MSKVLYLIIFLSVVLLKSETSFGQSLKKDLGVCGKTLGAVLQLFPKDAPSFSEFSLRDDEFCDKGRYEHKANFKIYLYNSKNELVYDKFIFLNPYTFKETMDKKDPTRFVKTEIAQNENARIVKFPISQEMGQVTHYKIESLKDKKVYALKKVVVKQ